MENKENNKTIIGVLITIVILLLLVICYLLFGRNLLNKNEPETNNGDTTDYSSEIVSYYWCKSATERWTTCLAFDEDAVRYGEPGTDAITDGLELDKVLKVSENVYEIYGTNGQYTLDSENASTEDELVYKYNIVWKINYSAADNSITILEGKRTYLNGEKPEEIVNAYNNLKLYKRNASDFN